MDQILSHIFFGTRKILLYIFFTIIPESAAGMVLMPKICHLAPKSVLYSNIKIFSVSPTIFEKTSEDKHESFFNHPVSICQFPVDD